MILLSNIAIKFYFSQSNLFNINLILISLGIISIIFHFSKAFIFLKEIFSTIINSRILNVLFLYPSLFFSLHFDLKKNFLESNLQIFNYPINNIIKISYIAYMILLVLFDMSTGNYFITHTPFNYFITISIYILLIILFAFSMLIYKFNIENKIDGKNNEIIKMILFLFEFYINDESNRLMILIIFILFEYFSEIYEEKIKKINKIIISNILININEIFYLLVHRVYSLETSKKFLSKTIGYSIDSFKISEIILEVFYKARFSFILIGYFIKMNVFEDKEDNKNDLYILRFILNIKCCLNFIFFSYEFIYLKNNSDYMTLMVYSFVDLSVFLLDFISFLISSCNSIIINNGYQAIKNS